MSKIVLINVYGVFIDVTPRMSKDLERAIKSVEMSLLKIWPEHSKSPAELRLAAKNVIRVYLEQVDD